jgi:outer membrane protein assembly factor BamB
VQHISIFCSRCQQRFQVEPSLLGKKIRCPTSGCREILEVKEIPVVEAKPTTLAPQKQSPPGTNRVSGNVGEVVPILPAWQNTPPPVRGSSPQVAPRVEAGRHVPANGPIAAPDVADWRSAPPRSDTQHGIPLPVEEPDATTAPRWEPPPIRRGPGANAPSESEPASLAPVDYDSEHVHAKRRRSVWLFRGVLATFVLVLSAAGLVGWKYYKDEGKRLFRDAQENMEAGQFGPAADKFKRVAELPGEEADEAKFLAELAELRGDVYSSTPSFPGILDRVDEFNKAHATDPFLKKHSRDVGETVVKALADGIAWATANPGEAALPLIDRAEQTLAASDQVNRDGINGPERAKIQGSFHQARENVRIAQERQRFLDRLNALVVNPSAENVRNARAIIKQEAKAHPEWENAADVNQITDRLVKAHRNLVTYTDAPPPVVAKIAEDTEPSLLVDPLVRNAAALEPHDGRVWLALVRGVLYALSQNTGEVRWAIRVGVDTALLPIRLPATPANPVEMVLVLSADSKTLTALRADDGERLWTYPLGAPCLSRPIVIDRRAYVPTYDGKIHEIELAAGKAIGRYDVGQRLSVGGARQEGSKRLFFPADDSCVYIIDVGNRRCENILYSWHPNGSLRSAPVVITREEGATDTPQGFLILSQTDGLNITQLRTYALPIRDPQAEPLVMRPEPRLHGWPWFQPYCDGDKLVQATDAGRLGLFGVRQLRNQDNPVFALIRVEKDAKAIALGNAEDLFPGELSLGGAGAHPGRAQVVHVHENAFWVLAHGTLQKWLLAFDREKGPKLVSLWSSQLRLGSPLHESQIDEAEKTLFLVTRSPNEQTCLATAVDATDGTVRWQRQLGLVCQGAPIVLGQDVLGLDQGGGLFQFDTRKFQGKLASQWLIGSKKAANPLEESTETPMHLLPAADGATVYEVSCPGAGTHLVIRRMQAGGAGQAAAVNEQRIDINAPLAGTPGITPDSIVAPMANGTILRIPLPLGPVAKTGPEWRARRADPSAQGFVVGLENGDFLTTDGSNGLTRWRWPASGIWQTVPPNKNPSVELPARIIAAPVVLPSANPMVGSTICVADYRGVVTHLKDTLSEELRSWDLGGKITSGPFVRDRWVGVIVDRKRLVWLDPAKDKPAWEFTAESEAIVGQPQLVAKNLLLIAEQSGRFVGLDPTTGQQQGAGYTLRASVAPAATPVAFGASRIFAPLTDGTVMLISMDYFRAPAKP